MKKQLLLAALQVRMIFYLMQNIRNLTNKKYVTAVFVLILFSGIEAQTVDSITINHLFGAIKDNKLDSVKYFVERLGIPSCTLNILA